MGLSGPLGCLKGYNIWRSTLSIAKLSIVRSNIFACECGAWNHLVGQVLSQPANAEGQPQFRNGVDAGRLALSSIEVPVLDKSSLLALPLPTRLGVRWEASQRVLHWTRLIYQVPQPFLRLFSSFHSSSSPLSSWVLLLLLLLLLLLCTWIRTGSFRKSKKRSLIRACVNA